MFGLEWSKNAATESVDFSVYDDSIINSVSGIAPIMWGEHCLECGVPECYETCSKYSARDDKRCRRFENGIEKIGIGNGIYRYAVKISFREWGKLECIMFPVVFSFNKIKRLNAFFDITTSLTKKLPGYYARRFNYLYKEFITRKLGSFKGISPQILLVEIVNPGKPYKLIIERKTDGEVFYRNDLPISFGFNRYCIPCSEIGYTKGKRNNLSLFPENNREVVSYICSLDLVTLTKPLTECLEMPKIKCVVWDLDNTVWEGILSEGKGTVKLREEAANLIRDFDRKGILNSVSSKNDFKEAYDKLNEFGIAEYFLCPQINWETKSSHIRRISRILNIGIDSIAFVDDMSYEREEVRRALPMVRCFDANHLDAVKNDPGVDVPITSASALRRGSYLEIARRNSAEEEFKGELTDFVRECDIRVEATAPVEKEYLRCHELIQRTNQLNLSGKRITMEDMTVIFKSNEHISHAIKIKDKFGDYGLAGVAIYAVDKVERKIELIHFFVSCRAAGKLVEQSYLENMIRLAGKKGFGIFTVDCAITTKNHLIRQSVEDIMGKQRMYKDDLNYSLEAYCDTYEPKYSGVMSVRIL